MAAENANMWQTVLPAVYEVIQCKTDKIVDDTSLEKLLGLMEFINKNPERRSFLTNNETLKFLNDIRQSCSATAVGFGLRLAGIISSNLDGFNTLVNPASECDVFLLDSLFSKVIQEGEELWLHAVVRDSYFKGAMGVLDVSEGIVWVQKSGCLQQAMNCLVDSSIFVADSVRKLISKYLVTLYVSNQSQTAIQLTSLNGQHLEGTEIFHCHRRQDTIGSLKEEDLMCAQCIVCYLQCLIEMPPSGLERTMAYQVSVAQLLLSLMEENPSVAQDILRPSGIFLSCLQLLQCANTDECGKVVDVITTMMKNTSKWNINWELLLSAYGQDALCALLEFALVLCRRCLGFFQFQFTQGLFAMSCNRDVQDPWLCSLLTLITFPVIGSLRDVVANDIKGHNCNPRDTAKNLFSVIVSRDDAYQMLESFLATSLKEYLSSAAVSHSLLVTTEVIQELGELKVSGLPQLEHFIKSWANDVLTLLTRQSSNHQSGDHVLRQCIKALTVCVYPGFLRDQDGTVLQKEHETFNVLLKLSSERSDGQVLTGCLESIKALLLCADHLSLIRYIQESVGKVTLATVLRRLCSHSCWDVKDSVVGFLKCLLDKFTAEKMKLFQGFLIEHRLLDLVWTLTNDIDSYVRASVYQLVGVISNNDVLWKNFLDAIKLSPEGIFRRVLDAFVDDEAAFSRRAMIELFSFWLNNRHELVSLMLRKDDSVCNQGPYRFLQGTKLDSCVAEILEKACQDFDWEVKVCALNCWESIVKRCDEFDGESDDFATVLNPTARIGFLSSIGFDKVVFGALIDCDKPVREKGLELLQLLRGRVGIDAKESVTLEQKGEMKCIESVDELEDYVLQISNVTSSTLGEVLAATDLSQLVLGCDDNDLFSDPLPFLKDILLAATDSHDNLLDCY